MLRARQAAERQRLRLVHSVVFSKMPKAALRLAVRVVLSAARAAIAAE
jgi:hypothetical protein